MPEVESRVVGGTALSVDSGQRAMNRVLAEMAPGRGPTAVIASNDLIALGALRALRDHGLRCPDDVSVVGFNDIEFAQDFTPPLTTVRVPMHDMGTEAARTLLEIISSGQREREALRLPVSLIVRGSTGAAAD